MEAHEAQPVPLREREVDRVRVAWCIDLDPLSQLLTVGQGLPPRTGGQGLVDLFPIHCRYNFFPKASLRQQESLPIESGDQ